ncbi:ATP-binding protein [Kitasatospora sp. NPDC002227]|uniref:AAA family ATPase n=1 Tax=Kitasatospora sp. NPDC002227 TaxID=3154773 RepID=UPI00332C8F48
MQNELWQRIPAEVRPDVERLVRADRSIQAIRLMMEQATPAPALRECIELLQDLLDPPRVPSTVVLMCGPPGAGKTTHAKALERWGYVRLSIDEVVWERLGGRDAGVVLPQAEWDALKEEVRAEQRLRLVELIRDGRDVVVDYSFWSRAAREDYKTLVESHGARWQLLHLKADRATLERRIAARNLESGPNAVTLDAALFDRYLANFEEPVGEGETVIGASEA